MLTFHLLLSFLHLHSAKSSLLHIRSWPTDLRRLVSRTGSTTQPPRDVYVQFSTSWSADASTALSDRLAQLDAQDLGSGIMHASLEVLGDGISNGNIRIEIDATGPAGFDFVVDVNDYGLGNPTDPPPSRFASNVYVRSIKVGSVSLSNSDLLDQTGNGIVSEVWTTNPQYSTVTNNCIRLVSNLVDKLGLDPPPDVAQYFADAKNPLLMVTRYKMKLINNVPVRLITRPDSTNPAQLSRRSSMSRISAISKSLILQQMHFLSSRGKLLALLVIRSNHSATGMLPRTFLSQECLMRLNFSPSL
jgi:hypothetical protein